MFRVVVITVAALTIAACGSPSYVPGPSVEDGGLEVFRLSVPDDFDEVAMANKLHEALGLPDDIEARRRNDQLARLDESGFSIAVRDRGAGPIIVTFSGPRSDNTTCVDCPPLDDTDDVDIAIEKSYDILETIGYARDLVALEPASRFDSFYQIWGRIDIDGIPVPGVSFSFAWTHGYELRNMQASFVEIERIGTVSPITEAEARTRADELVDFGRKVESIEFAYISVNRDDDLIAAPVWSVTTDAGNILNVSAFDGPLPP